MMDTPPTQHDTPTPPTDPALDALLDRAVADATPAPSADLADRIYRETQPMLGRREPVLARIGPTLLRAAAAVAILAGGLWAVILTRTPVTPGDLAVAPPDVETIATEFAALDNPADRGNTAIDQQLEVLALRLDLVVADNGWGHDEVSTNALIERAVSNYEIDRFADDATMAMADDTTWF